MGTAPCQLNNLNSDYVYINNYDMVRVLMEVQLPDVLSLYMGIW